MTIRLLEGIQLAGVHQAVGSILTLTPDAEARHVSSNRAVYTTLPNIGDNSTPVMASKTVTGGVGILADGVQVGGDASPHDFTTRTLTAADNGLTLICSSSQTVTVNTGMAAGFGMVFKGTISFTAGSGVTITDVRTTGSANPWCALMQTGVNTYDVVGTKA